MIRSTSADRPTNRRILIVDDTSAIHMDFRKTLTPANADTSELDEVEREFLGGEPIEVRPVEFDLDFADQGEVGVRKVGAAAKAGQPYAVAFVDMRMPPGWDGLRIIEEIWQQDPNVEIVICTAYSDHSWHEIFQHLGNSHQLLILQKPFDPVEVMQLAASLTHKWDLARLARSQIETLNTRVVEGVAALELLDQQNRTVLEWVGQPVVAIDQKGQIQFVNQAAGEALGGSDRDFEQRSFHELIHSTHRPDDDCSWNSWEQIDNLSHECVRADVFHRIDGTQVRVEFIVSLTQGSDGVLVGAVIMFSVALEETGF